MRKTHDFFICLNQELIKDVIFSDCDNYRPPRKAFSTERPQTTSSKPRFVAFGSQGSNLFCSSSDVWSHCKSYS